MTQSTSAEPRRRRWPIALVVVLIAAIGMAVWALRGPDGEIPGFHAELASSAGAAGLGGEVSMTELAGFGWDSVHVFPAYHTVSTVQEELGFAWSPLSPAATLLFGDFLLSNEGLTLLVFVTDDDRVTGWTILGSQYLEEPYIEMSPDGRHTTIERENSTLEVMQPPFVPGPNAYLLVPNVSDRLGRASLASPAPAVGQVVGRGACGV